MSNPGKQPQDQLHRVRLDRHRANQEVLYNRLWLELRRLGPGVHQLFIRKRGYRRRLSIRRCANRQSAGSALLGRIWQQRRWRSSPRRARSPCPLSTSPAAIALPLFRRSRERACRLVGINPSSRAPAKKPGLPCEELFAHEPQSVGAAVKPPREASEHRRLIGILFQIELAHDVVAFLAHGDQLFIALLPLPSRFAESCIDSGYMPETNSAVVPDVLAHRALRVE